MASIPQAPLFPDSGATKELKRELNPRLQAGKLPVNKVPLALRHWL